MLITEEILKNVSTYDIFLSLLVSVVQVHCFFHMSVLYTSVLNFRKCATRDRSIVVKDSCFKVIPKGIKISKLKGLVFEITI